MECNDILKDGIYDYKSIQTDHSKSIWYVNHLIKSNYSTLEDAKNSEASVNIPIEDVMVGLGFSRDERGFREFKSYIEDYTSYHKEEQDRLDATLKTINTDIINVWKECISTDGPHIWIVHTHDPKKIILGTRFNGDNKNPRMTHVSWGTAVEASNGPYFFENGMLRANPVIKHSIRYQEIARRTTDPINIVINLDLGQAFIFDLPEIHGPVPDTYKRKFDNDGSRKVHGVRSLEATIINDTGTNRYLKGEVEFFLYSYMGNGGTLDLRCYVNDERVDEIAHLAIAVTAGPKLTIPEFKFQQGAQVRIRAALENWDGIDADHGWIEIKWKY